MAAGGDPGTHKDFANRVGNAFSALDSIAEIKGASAPPWQLHQSLVFRDGGGNGDSSEEEEKEAAAEWQEDLMDLGSSEPFVPTGAFCRALDREAEFDDADELAAHTLHGGGSESEAKPARSMEVLDDSTYEKAYADNQQPCKGVFFDGGTAVAGTTTVVAASGSTVAQIAPAQQSTLVHDSGKQSRVRFDVPSSTARSRGIQPRLQGSQPQDRQMSRLPDYVVHPDKYICYELDEPLLIGGGGEGSSEREVMQAAMSVSASGASMQSDPVESGTQSTLPVGAGIAFRPRADKSSATTAAGAAAVKVSGPLALQEQEPEISADAPAAVALPQKRRKFRTKSDS